MQLWPCVGKVCALGHKCKVQLGHGGDELRIHVAGVDRQTWGNFCSYVLREKGKMRGVLGEELTRALDNWLQDSVRNYIIRSKTRGDVKMTEDKLAARLEAIDGAAITDEDFHQLCRNMGLLDDRTHRRYLKALLERKVLQHKAISPSGIIIFRINHEHYATFANLLDTQTKGKEVA